GLAWTSNGQELIFSSNRNGRHQLWRVKVNGTAQPTVVEGISEASSPAISSTRPGSDSRLVYQALTGRDNILESRHVDRERESISQAQKIGPSRAVDRVMDGSA
ncbi:MAG: hypothetical protein DMF92_21815, partial [Acidobacteria bacterium]